MSEQPLKTGSSGAAVEKFQKALVGVGFEVGAIDGRFGPVTAETTRAFQISMGLSPTGVVDDQTWEAVSSLPPVGKGTPLLFRNPQDPYRRHIVPDCVEDAPGVKRTASTKGER